ncbi:hypothetical protein BB8028_0003g11250 [Beauveria bassiana]|uniref:Uncharacterized protein n=1 Tax=Beauveria bassiana TaxID=176275 RepID=A0A2S7Y8L6_BEABA|nr:hypothetical protein BB8028_0003g11250 [Beauveria bassiana]
MSGHHYCRVQAYLSIACRRISARLPKLRLVHDHLLVTSSSCGATEAMGLAAKAGLNTNQVYDMIVSAAGNFYSIRNDGQEDARRGPGAYIYLRVKPPINWQILVTFHIYLA